MQIEQYLTINFLCFFKILHSQIIKAGANINVTDVDGWTALHAAAHWGQKEACEILLENNCDTSIKDSCVSSKECVELAFMHHKIF